MNEKPPPRDELLYAARKLAPYLPPDLRREVNRLLRQARRGQAVRARLLDMLTEDASARAWLREVIAPFTRESLLSGFTPLPGEVGPISARRWICPEPDCNFIFTIRHAGQKPTCPRHRIPLIPWGQKRHTQMAQEPHPHEGGS